MKLVLGAIICLSLCVVHIQAVNNKLKEVFAWKFVDYEWGKPEDREAAIASGEFVPANNLPLGLEVWKDKLFITVPRWKNGVVSTLNYIKITDNEVTTPLPPETPVTPDPAEEAETPEPEDDTEEPEDETEATEDVTPPEDPTTPTLPDDLTTPTTPPPPTTLENTTPTDPDDATPLPTASILPMPARSFNFGRNLIERSRRAVLESDDEEEYSNKNIFGDKLVRKVTRKSKKKNKKDDDEEEEDEEKKKKKTKKCDKKENETEEKKKKKKKKSDKDENETEDKKEKKKNKNKKDDDKKDKKKKKKKCKPKPKPKPTTTAEPTATTPATDVTDTSEPTDTTMGTETTAPPPPAPRSPALIPYPSFAANRVILDGNKTDDATPIVSVFRVWADTCDRLWVMDTGVADILGKTTVVSKPRILIYDLNNDELLKTYEFKDSDSEEHSFFANIIVDNDPNNCDKAFAYVPDLGGYGIVSYDFANDKTRRIKHNFFHFDPLAGNMEVGGVNFQWTDGVFSIALGKPMDDGYRTAYFHCLASTKEFSVSTKVLKNGDGEGDSYYDYKLVGDRGANSQSSASYIHEDTGVMFYTQLQKDSVNCWNINKPLTSNNLAEVASDNETMIFTNDLKVDREGNLWVLTDKLPVFIYRGLDDSEVNYRIFTATVDEAVAGTSCAP